MKAWGGAAGVAGIAGGIELSWERCRGSATDRQMSALRRRTWWSQGPVARIGPLHGDRGVLKREAPIDSCPGAVWRARTKAGPPHGAAWDRDPGDSSTGRAMHSVRFPACSANCLFQGGCGLPPAAARGSRTPGHARRCGAGSVDRSDSVVSCGRAWAAATRPAVERLVERLGLPVSTTKTRCPCGLEEPLKVLEIRIWRDCRPHSDVGMRPGQVSLHKVGRTGRARTEARIACRPQRTW